MREIVIARILWYASKLYHIGNRKRYRVGGCPTYGMHSYHNSDCLMVAGWTTPYGDSYEDHCNMRGANMMLLSTCGLEYYLGTVSDELLLECLDQMACDYYRCSIPH